MRTALEYCLNASFGDFWHPARIDRRRPGNSITPTPTLWRGLSGSLVRGGRGVNAY